MRSSRNRPVSLSSSYLTLDPMGISMTEVNSVGRRAPGVTSCQAWVIRGLLWSIRISPADYRMAQPSISHPLREHQLLTQRTFSAGSHFGWYNIWLDASFCPVRLTVPFV